MKKWVIYGFLLVCWGFLWAQQTNLVVQQVGVVSLGKGDFEPIGKFLAEEIIGYSERTNTRIVSARQDDLELLKVKNLSGIVLVDFHQTNETGVIDLRFAESKKTNEIKSFATFALKNWMVEIPKIAKLVASEIQRRYPPRPKAEIQTIEVVKTYSPYEVRGHELALGFASGYWGNKLKTRGWYLSAGNNTNVSLTGFSGTLYLLWRTGLWYVEGQIQGAFGEDNIYIAESQAGYGLLGGIVSPLVGGFFAYQEHFWEMAGVEGVSTNLEFMTLVTGPIVGIRISFQPTFWVTFSGGGLPGVALPVLMAEGMPESFEGNFSTSFFKIQASFKYQKNWIFFFSWRMWMSRLEWKEEGYELDSIWRIQEASDELGAVMIGGAYVF
ncbi:hypothetical protein [Thermospira aquatica]|uniref:DUF3575 domain-containing protein n=1 Tax=Thermospira aquatica TaxID=2828656 RepID=A0AAX3BE42_9SPIR|nr:hypothetical protein [Thermospira aquatica]URA10373.1 hypothetical protein KDW03_00785 [Thermospira aquatica]